MDETKLTCLLQIFDTEPAEGLRTAATSSQALHEAAAIASVSPSGFVPSQQIYARVVNPDQAMPTYATIPARGSAHGPVLRNSSSQDHLAGRAACQVSYQVPSHRTGPPFVPHPVPGPSTFDVPVNGSRPPRPLAMYQPWNSSQTQSFAQALDVASQPSSGSSSDSGTQAATFHSPSSSPSNAVFYAYGPTRPPQPLTQAPAPPQSALSPPTGRRVRALYNCVGENPAELSFEPNAVIVNGAYLLQICACTD